MQFKSITESAYLNLFTGIVLLATSSSDIIATIHETDLHTHHGVALFGLIQIIKSLPDILHSLEFMQKHNRQQE